MHRQGGASHIYRPRAIGQVTDTVTNTVTNTITDTAADFVQKSHIFSLDVMYDLTPRWTIGGKYAYRLGQISEDRVTPEFFDSRAHLYVLRADWHFVHKWDALIESYFQAVLSWDPANKHALSNLALVAARRNQYDKALAALKQVGDEAQAYNNLGYICLLNGEYSAAERFLREAVRISSTYNKTAQENLATLRSLRSPK